MEKIKSDLLGVASLVASLIGVAISFGGSSVSIFFVAVGFILAIADIVIGFRKEQLAFQEYVSVAVKEKTFAVITIFVAIIFSCFIPSIILYSSI